MTVRSKPGVVIDRPKIYRRVPGDVDGALELIANESESEFKTLDETMRELARRARRRAKRGL